MRLKFDNARVSLHINSYQQLPQARKKLTVRIRGIRIMQSARVYAGASWTNMGQSSTRTCCPPTSLAWKPLEQFGGNPNEAKREPRTKTGTTIRRQHGKKAFTKHNSGPHFNSEVWQLSSCPMYLISIAWPFSVPLFLAFSSRCFADSHPLSVPTFGKCNSRCSHCGCWRPAVDANSARQLCPHVPTLLPKVHTDRHLFRV